MPEFTTDFRLYREALFADDAAIVLWDPEANEAALDNAGSSVFGPTLETALKDKAFASFYFIREDDRDRVRTAATDLMTKVTEAEDRSQSFRYSTECHFVDGEGIQTWCELHFVARKEDDGTIHMLTVFRNDEKDHRREEELRSQADTDSMTGVNNKRRTKELIDALLNTGASGSLIVFDLDRFKNVNDTLGHLVGDAVISDMALCLKATFRENDVVGRVGGDEFVVFMPKTTSFAIVEARIEEARSKIKRDLKYADGSLSLTCSAGVGYAPSDGATYDDLFKHADAALYYAKEHGRDRHAVYSDGMKMSELAVAAVDSEDRESGTLQDDPIAFIFSVLFETRDVKMTTDLLLELFGKYFDVQRAFVYRRLPDMSWTCFFDWHDRRVDPPYVAHEGIVTDFINMNYRRTPMGLYSELTSADDPSPEVSKVLKERSIHAFLHAGIMNGDDKFGCVGMDDCTRDRVWTEREHLVLRAFADILGSFLVKQVNEEGEVDENARLDDILESITRSIFIVDPDDGALLFANGQARSKFDVPDDYSSMGALPLQHKGFPVTWRDGRTVTCHVLSA